MNVIGDSEGNLDAILRLIDKMPKDDTVLIGDIIDRGPKSKETIEWAINSNVEVLLGNHEHMFIDHILGQRMYEPGMWFQVGGDATMDSYGLLDVGHSYGTNHDNKDIIKHLEWLQERPLIKYIDGFVLTHAPINFRVPLEQTIDPNRLNHGESVIWNRDEPAKIDGVVQLFGHNSNWGLKYFNEVVDPNARPSFGSRPKSQSDKPAWAICLDTSRKRVITGINTKTMEIFQEDHVK